MTTKIDPMMNELRHAKQLLAELTREGVDREEALRLLELAALGRIANQLEAMTKVSGESMAHLSVIKGCAQELTKVRAGR
jgi:hypothetical protein